MAKNLPETSPYKSWLVICAPTASVVIGGLLLWARNQFNQLMERIALNARLTEARQTLKEALENPRTSDAHKVKMQESMEKLERLVVEDRLSRVKELVDP